MTISFKIMTAFFKITSVSLKITTKSFKIIPISSKIMTVSFKITTKSFKITAVSFKIMTVSFKIMTVFLESLGTKLKGENSTNIPYSVVKVPTGLRLSEWGPKTTPCKRDHLYLITRLLLSEGGVSSIVEILKWVCTHSVVSNKSRFS